MSARQKKQLYLIIGSAFLFICGTLIKNTFLSLLLLIFSYSLVGYKSIKKAVINIFHGQIFDENFLMVLASMGAIVTHNYSEAVMVMLLYQIGEWFQSYAIGQSRKSISDLMEINPDYANLVTETGIQQVDPYEVQIGDLIIVKNGEKIPLDGRVIEGHATLDAKALTGESLPIDIKTGDQVISGCINQDGYLKIAVTKLYEDSTVAKILDLVENAASEKAPTENFVTKFAKYYTPVVVILAVLLAVIPPLFFNASWEDYILRACSFLVISCPCALVISIPLGFFAGIGRASRDGILIKGSEYVELLNQVRHLVFDKTGTLTDATFKVKKIVTNRLPEKDLMRILASIESHSNHPIAKAINRQFKDIIEYDLVQNFKEIAGKGVSATFENVKYYIGNAKLLKEHDINFDLIEDVDNVIYIANENAFIGYVTIGDTLKENAQTSLKSLKEKELTSYMLTGDKQSIGEATARELNIQNYYCELLPQDKVQKFKMIQENVKPHKVGFVGDGINDAPVLISADVGIAMGGLGSASAIEAADIVIMDDKLNKINLAIDICHQTIMIVKMNIVFVLLIKFIVLLMGALGNIPMWLAIFADVGTLIIAILNSMRILVYKQ